jgi:hypothetical protein
MIPCAVWTMNMETRSAGFLVEPQNQGRKFLPVWPQNRWRRFLGLGLKTKRASIYRLHHKIDERRLAWKTCQDLAACIAWKQVRLGFPSLPQNLRRRDGGWCTWHHHGDHVELKLKTDRLM